MCKNFLAVTIATFITFPLVAKAEGTPQWIKRPPVEDDKYRFYVGRASGLEAESILIEKAIKNAREMAIAENFGVLTSIVKESYQTMNSSSMYQKFLNCQN